MAFYAVRHTGPTCRPFARNMDDLGTHFARYYEEEDILDRNSFSPADTATEDPTLRVSLEEALACI